MTQTVGQFLRIIDIKIMREIYTTKINEDPETGEENEIDINT